MQNSHCEYEVVGLDERFLNIKFIGADILWSEWVKKCTGPKRFRLPYGMAGTQVSDYTPHYMPQLYI